MKISSHPFATVLAQLWRKTKRALHPQICPNYVLWAEMSMLPQRPALSPKCKKNYSLGFLLERWREGEGKRNTRKLRYWRGIAKVMIIHLIIIETQSYNSVASMKIAILGSRITASCYFFFEQLIRPRTDFCESVWWSTWDQKIMVLTCYKLDHQFSTTLISRPNPSKHDHHM